MNQITVNFIECEPTPDNGYNVIWRLKGSSDTYTDGGNFTSSPAIFTDNTNPDGSDYEGFIRSDCSESGESGSNFGSPVAWNTDSGSESGGVNGNIDNISSAQIDNMSYGGINLNYIDGDTLPMVGIGSGNYSLPYTTSGDTFVINVSGAAFTQIKVTDNAGDHIQPYVGSGSYFFTLTLNPMFIVFSVEVS